MQAKKVRIYLDVKEVKFKDGKKEKTFLACKTPIGALNCDVKFTQEAEDLKPNKSGYFEISSDKLSLDTRNDYPCIWVRA